MQRKMELFFIYTNIYLNGAISNAQLYSLLFLLFEIFLAFFRRLFMQGPISIGQIILKKNTDELQYYFYTNTKDT